jgi:cell division protein FtsI/penicillin-binding protein 2
MAQYRAIETRRVWLPAAFFGAFALLIFARLFQLQVLEHSSYASTAQQELLGDDVIYARRGAILDRNGNVLAMSVDTWDIYVSSRAWKDPARATAASEALGKALTIDPAELRRTVAASKSVDVLIRRDVDYEVGKTLLKANLTGIIGLPNTARVNPEGDTAASVLGLIGLDNTGLAGIEAALNNDLQGKPGRAVYERDTTGEPIPFAQHVAQKPTAGSDLQLTIDRYIQQLVERTLDQGIKDHRAQGGDIIVMDPTNGDILAFASRPGLQYSTLNLDDPKSMELLRNRAVTDLYEPGSVMKVVTASGAIDAGVVSPDTTYVDTGVAHIYEISLKNWDDRVYGTQTMTQVLQNSINTGAVFMVEKLGAKAFQSYLDAFGFGKPTGIELTGEADGIIRRPGDRNYSPVDVATQAFGQSISVTPLQMITAIAASINGGKLYKPHLVKSIIAPGGKRTDRQPEVVAKPIRPDTSATIREMLDAVVNPEGFRYPGAPRDYRAGGKSGTANVPIPNGYDDRQIASFIGFAPVDSPKVIILVKLDQNQDLATGTQAAAPIFARLADDILHYLGVAPGATKAVAKP